MNDRIDALERLHKLHAQGVLSDPEYAREKAAIIGQDHEQSETVAPQPRAHGVQLERQNLVGSFSLKRTLMLAVAAMLVCGAIGAYFFVKAYNIAKERGELSHTPALPSSNATAPAAQQPPSDAVPANAPALTASPAYWDAEHTSGSDGYLCELTTGTKETYLVTVDIFDSGKSGSLHIEHANMVPDIEGQIPATLAFSNGAVIHATATLVASIGLFVDTPAGSALGAAFSHSTSVTYRDANHDTVTLPISAPQEFAQKWASCKRQA